MCTLAIIDDVTIHLPSRDTGNDIVESASSIGRSAPRSLLYDPTNQQLYFSLDLAVTKHWQQKYLLSSPAKTYPSLTAAQPGMATLIDKGDAGSAESLHRC